MMLCLAATVPQLHAAIVVAGDNTSLFGASWSANANGSNEMTRYGSSNDYYLAKPNVTLSGTTEYKVVDNGSWYPSSNLSFTANGTNSLVFVYNNSSHNVALYGTFNVVVAGNDTQALGSSWSGNDSNNGMTTCDACTLKLTRTVNYTASGNKEFKVVYNGNTWYGNSAGGNVSYNIPSAGEYDITYTFNVISKEVTAIVTPKSVTPVTPNYYITGDGGLVPSGWSYAPTTAMTYDENNDVYTYSHNVTTAGTYYFAFADGGSNSWDDFNANHRYGPTGGNAEVNVDGTWTTTQKSANSYYITVDPGQVTITFDIAHSRFKVVGTAPAAPADYYVVGENTTIFPNGWSTGTENLMIDNNGTYTWTANNVHLVAGTNYEYKVLGSDNSWHPSGNNATFSVDASGTYNVVFTFDGTNVNAVATLIQADPIYTYDIYVRYDGTEPIGNVYLYAWDSNGTLSDAWEGSTGGTALSSLTSQEINGYTYYQVTYSSYSSTINAIFNENGSSSTQTADLTLQPGTSYFTYGGGSTVSGPNAEADAAIAYYVTGEDTNIFPNGWSTGTETQMTLDNGIYTWTAAQVHLIPDSLYSYKVYCSDGTWHPDGDNKTFDVHIPGTYTVTVTYDSSTGTVDATVTLIEPDPISNVYVIGYANTQQWAANAGLPMMYDAIEGCYVRRNVVLTANSNFAFATYLGEKSTDWETTNANRFSSNGESNWAITEDWIDTWMDYVPYSGENHNWYVDRQGAYDIFFNPSTRKVKIARSNHDMYIAYGVNWNWQDNSTMMTTVDGNVYQATITLNQGDYFLFAEQPTGENTWGADDNGYEINDFMVNYGQKLNQNTTNNYHFVGATGKYIVVVNLEKGTVTLRRTADGGTKTQTKIYLQKTSNVELDPAGGTYQGQTLEGKRGGIYAWNKLNLRNQNNQTYTVAVDGPTNYTYDGEVDIDGQGYVGNGYLKDINDTTTIDGKQWYAWSVSNSICEFYFIRQNNANDLKSQKIIRRSGEIWLTWIDEDATSNRQDNAQHCDSLMEVTRDYYQVSAGGVSDCETMLEDHYYVYYTNTTGWDSVYCYAWYEVGDNIVEFTRPYPGSKCTFVGYDEAGYEVWCYDFGLIEDYDMIPTNVIFDNGLGGGSEGEAGDNVRQQTGDLVFNNGACYDYLGLIYLGNSLSAIINSGVVYGPKYTVEDDLVGVYYDKNAVTEILVTDQSGNPLETLKVHGALYAKDMENYAAKSRMPEGTIDYVYDICAHTTSSTYPGGSQVQLKRTYYDQSNWVKIIISPNFDNANAKSNGDVNQSGNFDQMTYEDIENNILINDQHYLEQYVGRIIPGRTMSGNIVNNVNPQMHITNIAAPGNAYNYEKNVYIAPHFNDSVVFNYVHQEWAQGPYNGVHKTRPIMGTDQQGNQIVVDTEEDESTLYKMFYVAPKPQEVAYITWAVFYHPDPDNIVGTPECITEPNEPGAFYVPMNWNRKGQLWDGSDPNDPYGAWGTTYGPFSNGYKQYGAFQVNWSLFEDMEIPFNPNDPNAQQGREQEPWYRIFKPGQAYKILAIIRYAHGDKLDDVEYSPGVYKGDGYNEGNNPQNPDHVSNAPRRSNTTWLDMAFAPYDDLATSKFIVFPLRGSNEDSNGADLGNVTTVKEVNVARTPVSKRYYNLMGVESDKPFNGLNIIVTTYSDGSRSSSKVLMP